MTTAEARRIKELEQENRELRRANEVLKRASAFFASTRPPIEVTVGFVDENHSEFAFEFICRTLRLT